MQIPPRVSIIIPCYKQANFLREAVLSVVAQSYTDWECIIVNDGSPDNTSLVSRDLIAQYPQVKLRLLEKPNGGLADARNAGIRQSSGTYILPLDSDDALHPRALERMVAVLEAHPNIGIAYSDYETFEAKSEYIRCIDPATFQNPLRGENGLAYSSLYRRSVWDAVGGYNRNMTWGFEDWDFWIGCVEKGVKAHHITEPLFRYRVKAESMLTTAMKHNAELRAQIVLNHEPLFDEATRTWARQIGGTKAATTPAVSVIVPTFNRPLLLERALRSVLAQTFQDFEIIVVNDAGPSVRELVTAIDSRIRYVEHDKNRGLAATRNTGIAEAQGRYIAYLDDDDLFYPHHLEHLTRLLNEGTHEVVYSDAARGWQEERNGTYEVVKRDRPYSVDFNNDILCTNFIPVLCVMHTRRAITEVGPFDPELRRTEDWDLWRRLSRRYAFRHSPEVTCEFSWRSDGSSMTSSSRDSFDWAELLIYAKGRNELPSPYAERVTNQARAALARLTESIAIRSQHDDMASSTLLGGSNDELIERIESLKLSFPDLAGAWSALLAALHLERRDYIRARYLCELARSQAGALEGTNELLKFVPPIESNPNLAVSIIVPLYNACAHTQAMLASLLPTIADGRAEVIFVDNASKDATAAWLSTLPPSIRVISNKVNRNFAGACNQGAAAARSEVLLFLNSDTLVGPGWLEPLTQRMQQDPRLAILGNKHLYPYTGLVHHTGIALKSDGSNHHYLVETESDDPRVNFDRDLQAVNGACFVVRRDFFAQTGGFDTIYRNGAEDVDICLRARAKGYRVSYTPDSVIYHHGQASPERTRHDDRNSRILSDRWSGHIAEDLPQFEIQNLNAAQVAASHNFLGTSHHLAIVTPWNQPDHRAYHARCLYRALRSANPHSKISILAEQGPRFGCDASNILRAWRRHDRDSLRSLVQSLRDLNPSDVFIQYHPELYSGAELLELVTNLRGRVRTTILVHSRPADQSYFDQALALSHRALLLGGVSHPNAEVAPLGLRALVEPITTPSEAKALIGIPPGISVVATCGTLTPSKGGLEVIDAVAQIQSQRPTIFMHVGGADGANEQYRTACLERIKASGLANQAIIFPGYLPEGTYSRYLAAADLIVENSQVMHPTISDSLAFAASFHRPLVVRQGSTGPLVAGSTLQYSDAAELSATILAVLTDTGISDTLVRSCRELCQRESVEALVRMIGHCAADERRSCL